MKSKGIKISFRVTKEEAEFIKKNAYRCNKSLSEHIRECCINRYSEGDLKKRIIPFLIKHINEINSMKSTYPEPIHKRTMERIDEIWHILK